MEKNTEELQEKEAAEMSQEQPKDVEPLDELEEVFPEKELSASEAGPLVVCDENGGFLFFATTNRKGYTKSIEQGALWLTHPDTDRILPCGKEARLKQIQKRDDYYYAEVYVEGDAAAARPSFPAEASAAWSSTVPEEILSELAALIARRRKEKTEGSYTSYLFQEGVEKIRKKTGEEAIELILARTPHDIVYEAADLMYHMLVLLEAEDISLAAVLEELKSRR